MNADGVWLGRFRGVVRQTAVVSAGLTLLVFAILVFNKAFLDSGVGVHEMLRPEGGILARTFMMLLAFTLVVGSIYFSDIKGAIEPEKSGFFDIVSLVCSRLAMIVGHFY